MSAQTLTSWGANKQVSCIELQQENQCCPEYYQVSSMITRHWQIRKAQQSLTRRQGCLPGTYKAHNTHHSRMRSVITSELMQLRTVRRCIGMA